MNCLWDVSNNHKCGYECLNFEFDQIKKWDLLLHVYMSQSIVLH